MKATNVGIALGTVSLIISVCLFMWFSSHRPFGDDILVSLNLLCAVLGIGLCAYSEYRNPTNKTKIGIAIGVIAFLVTLASPNILK
jgi:multisubunit Na+/H+ antiporter MnhF subunit